MKKIVSVLLFLVTCLSCAKKDDYWNNFDKRGKKALTLSILKLDSIIMEDINSSGTGHFVYDENEILYLDKTSKFIFKFDNKGKHLGKYNGFGQGPDEFIVSNTLLSNNGNRVVLGDLETYYLLNKDFHIQKKGIIEWSSGNITQEEVYNSPKPTMPEIYEIIEYDNFPCLFKDSLALLPITTEHVKYNGFKNLDYYKEAHIFTVLDLKSGRIKELKGRRSPEYLKYEFLPNFDSFHFDYYNDKIYINYDIDSTIYVLDKEFQPQFKFGYAGTQMNCNYKPTHGFEDAEERFLTDRETFGYYRYLKFIKETGYLFRTYSKGGNKKDGLQIYDSKYNLVGDIEVPKGFRVIGYYNGKYLAECSKGLDAIPMYILSFTF